MLPCDSADNLACLLIKNLLGSHDTVELAMSPSNAVLLQFSLFSIACIINMIFVPVLLQHFGAESYSYSHNSGYNQENWHWVYYF